ncbi:dUTP diphosphatase [Candidatus Uhrbacteria bacterium]|nr:dUTP diphosphatase [Candidatus Uhrbacteria bacterium]
MDVPFPVTRLRPEIPMPEYKTPGAVGFDIGVSEAATIGPGETKILSTGLIVRVPEGYWLMLASRSSNAKKRLIMANGIGVIDQDYCGPNDELHLAIHNAGPTAYEVQNGERLAQGILIPIARGAFTETAAEGSSRGGFGSTG